MCVTLVASGEAEAAQTQWWRPVSWKWPGFAATPGLQVLDWSEGLSAESVKGSVALLIPDAGMGTAVVYSLLDGLCERMIPAVVCAPSGMSRGVGSNEDVVWLGTEEDPAMVASLLASLALRQPAVEMLRAEVRVSRRFHSGLRGQIEKVHEELQLAASVQREFLPRALPAAPNIDVQVLFRPCGYVSGDIYDVQKLDDRRWGFFVADAVGHGVPAALMTMVLCRCLTTTEEEGGVERVMSPSRTLKKLNQDLIKRHGEGSRFATAVYGVIDTQTRRVTLAGAGHPYPLRLRDGSVERVETEGGLLGIFAEDEFSEASFTLASDEMLVIYTDGFETAFPAPSADEYGRRLPNRNYVDRFVELARAWRGRGLPDAMRDLLVEMDRQEGSLHQTDDLTAMIVVPSSATALDLLFHGAEGSEASRGTGSAKGLSEPSGHHWS